MDEQQALDLAQAAVQAAMAAGAEWADAVAHSGQSLSVSCEKNTLRECTSSQGEFLGVRAYCRGGMGMATASGASAQVARQVGGQAAEMAAAASPDPDFHRLPEPRPLADPPLRWDDEVAGLPAARLVEWTLENIERGRATGGDGTFMGGGAGAGFGIGATASSTGVAVTSRSTGVSDYAYASVWRGDKAAAHGDGYSACRLSDLRREGFVEKAVRIAADLVDDEPIPTGRYDVIIDFDGSLWWIGSVLRAADAESVQRGRSFLVGKEGQQIASEVLTLIEDPFVPAGLRSTAWDGEGMPKVRRPLLDRGVLTTYLHNSYTAYKAGVELTGHAGRGGAYVGTGTSNLQLQPGEKTRAELIAEVDRGILIIGGSPQPDSVSGQVSSTIGGGFLIEGGEVKKAVKGAMFAGPIFDFLASADAVSSDYREDPGSISPAIRLRGVQISAE